MRLTSIKILNFRNLRSLHFAPHSEFNFICGQNAQGKTNLIEALYFASQLKSFRTNQRIELIGPHNEFAELALNVQENELDSELRVTLTAQERTALLNGKRLGQASLWFHKIPVLLFEPRHIYLFRDSPSKRRDFLARALFLQNPNTLKQVREYEQILTQKNKLLKSGFLDSLPEWNAQLVECGAQIRFDRYQWLIQINKVLPHEYQSISGCTEDLQLFSTIKNENNFGIDLNASLAEHRFYLARQLEEHTIEETARRESLVGPHRDDFRARLGSRDLSAFGSQGENRSAVIALHLAQIRLFENQYGKPPLFLLDDIASELDDNRCQHLFCWLQHHSAQVFLTTTENRWINENFKGHANVFSMQNGMLSNV